jgi:hypothetical protein
MSDEPIISKSPLPYQIAIFIVLNIWAVMCYELAQYQLVNFYQHIFSWSIYATLLLLSMTPVLSFFSWKLKGTIEVYDPIWEVKVREVNIDEFEKMVQNYSSSYRYFLVAFDYRLLLMTILSYTAFIALPFYTMGTNLLLISLTPMLISLVAIIFGMFFAYFIFKFIPNSAAREFPTHYPKRFRNAISSMMSIPGIFWSGVRLSIGESHGFYTIRDPIPIARIEGIEGVARLECIINNSGTITQVLPIFETDVLSKSNQVEAIIQPINSLKIAHLIQSMIEVYIQHSGGEEILEEILEEIDMFLKKLSEIDESSQ